MTLNVLAKTVLAFTLRARCVSVVRSPAGTESLAVQNKANSQRIAARISLLVSRRGGCVKQSQFAGSLKFEVAGVKQEGTGVGLSDFMLQTSHFTLCKTKPILVQVP